MNTILQKRIEEVAENHEQCYNVGEEHGYLYTHKGDIKEAVIYGADFALQNQWISVEEALPEYDEDVFVRFISRFPNNTDEFEVGYCTRWRTLDESVKTDSKGFSIIGDMEITHFMPIPEMKGGEE